MGSAYWGGLERPIAWCCKAGCRSRGREGKDGMRLCPTHRAEKNKAQAPAKPEPKEAKS